MSENEAGKAKLTSTTDEQISQEELQRRMNEARERIAQTVTEIKETVTKQHAESRELIGIATEFDERLDGTELEELIDESLAMVERSREKMKREQIEIDRLKSETRAMISKLLAA